MDQRQRKLLEDNSLQLADALKFDEVAELLRNAKLISNEKIEEIKNCPLSYLDLQSLIQAVKAESSFTRKLRLLHALQESDSITAFNEFITILESLNNTKALEIISPASINKRETHMDNSKKLVEKFSQFIPIGRYPIGMNSGSSSMTKSTGYKHMGDTTLSPLKEKHQATLVCSSGTANKNLACDSIGEQVVCNKCESCKTSDTTNKGFATPATAGCRNNTRGRLRETDRIFTTRSSQTPTRAQELSLIQNLSISDEDDDCREGEKPIVCWHPYAQPQPANQGSSRASSPHSCHPCCVSLSSDSDSSSDSLSIDQSVIVDSNVTMAIAKHEINTMSVKPATKIHNNANDYKMTARPRGPCLIVNNIDFEADMFPKRKGSDEDAKRFDDIFQQLGFTVIMRRNQTADQMRELFKEVAKECKPEHDALFVIILSHGSEDGIYGTDGMEVYLNTEIIACFDNRNCKAMREKPKVFVVQACRGRAKDFGGDGDTTDSIVSSAPSPSIRASSQINQMDTSWFPSSAPPYRRHRDKPKHPVLSDTLIVFPCLAGYVSVRNELVGSWLGTALSYYIMKHAHEEHLIDILCKVTRDIKQRESSDGHVQSVQLVTSGWCKNLYFNPGIYL